MAKKEIKVTINCSEKTCGACSAKVSQRLGIAKCVIFNEYLDMSDNSIGHKRCKKCLDSEVKTV